MPALAHTIDEALERFTLVNGAGDPDDGTACVMTALSWVKGEVWTDRLPCVHPLVREAVIRANDQGATGDRRLLLRHPSGILDTWWIPTDVVLYAMSRGDRRAIDMVRELAAWKEGKPRRTLRGANLDGANLGGANLDGANLGGANLSGANLDGANLRGANLSGADLRGANLDGANLDGANLRGANLDGANLRGANLGGANLDGANLRGANLRWASSSSATRWPDGFTPPER